MNICGIICEYNPFHNGHKYQIARTREILGEDTLIVCLMSGNYVQRGDAALYHKNVRAKAAVLEGADVVLELPLPYALSSAEGFARGAVDILSKTGCTHLSFGAEDDNVDSLREIASLLLEKSTIDATLANLTSGISYAVARERAVYAQIKEKAALLKSPNNILAIEYIKAIISLESNMIPVAVKRLGAGHDTADVVENTASATYIRSVIRDGGNADALMPAKACEVFKNAPVHRINDDIVMSHLIRLNADDIRQFADVSEGLEYRIFDAIQSSFSFDEVCEKAKSKRYAHARIRRILMNAFLGIKKADVPDAYPYVKLLAFTDRGRGLLAENRDNEKIKLITKPAHIRDMDDEANRLLDMEIRASRLYYMFGGGTYINEFKSPEYVGSPKANS